MKKDKNLLKYLGAGELKKIKIINVIRFIKTIDIINCDSVSIIFDYEKIINQILFDYFLFI